MNFIKKLFGKRETSLVKGVRYVFDNGRVFFTSKEAVAYQEATGYSFKALRKVVALLAITVIINGYSFKDGELCVDYVKDGQQYKGVYVEDFFDDVSDAMEADMLRKGIIFPLDEKGAAAATANEKGGDN